MSQSVVVLTPNGRRVTVKMMPNSTVLEALETACGKHKFDPDCYNLMHHNKVLDLSSMFRFSGLPNNCTLEMVEAEKKRTESEVEICLQLEDNSRKSGNFKSSTTLKEIIGALCPESQQSNPNHVIIYMRKEVYGEELGKTDLKTLGLQRGKALLRLLNKNPEELKTQANISAPLPQKPKEESIEETPKSRHALKPAAANTVLTPDLIKSLKNKGESSKMEVDEPVKPTTSEPIEENKEMEVVRPEKPAEVPKKVEAVERMDETPIPEPEIHVVSLNTFHFYIKVRYIKVFLRFISAG